MFQRSFKGVSREIEKGGLFENALSVDKGGL